MLSSMSGLGEVFFEVGGGILGRRCHVRNDPANYHREGRLLIETGPVVLTWMPQSGRDSRGVGEGLGRGRSPPNETITNDRRLHKRVATSAFLPQLLDSYLELTSKLSLTVASSSLETSVQFVV